MISKVVCWCHWPWSQILERAKDHQEARGGISGSQESALFEAPVVVYAICLFVPSRYVGTLCEKRGRSLLVVSLTANSDTFTLKGITILFLGELQSDPTEHT